MDEQPLVPSPPRMPGQPIRQPVDPVERLLPLGLQLFGILICTILFWQAADSSSAFPPLPQSMFYNLYYVGIITPLHEGGHFLFMLFGRTLYILGGSFWQVMTPLILFGVALRQKSFLAYIWLSLAGTHWIALAPYIYDAPYRSLPLLGGHKSGHDWYNLLIHWQMLDDAASISDFVYYAGVLMGIGALVAGVTVAVRTYMKSPRYKT
ncbi:MAG TPA: hypothetical protein VMM37_07245, partial [Bacteroidota bacterium]|nr:hypothetical protein [Bacteroidota bacterium]